MSRIRGKNTKPEIKVRSLLHRMGYRFRLTKNSLPGKPDIILPRYHTVVFVHGCFWHRHEGCRYAYTPKSRTEFWDEKFASNIKRDRVVSEQIREASWNQLVVWECELKDEEGLKNRLKAILHD